MSTRRLAALLFGACLLVYVGTAAYRDQSIDTVSTLIPAWQLAHHGNLTMDAFAKPDLWFVHAHGRLVSTRFPGAVLFAAPFYLWLDHAPQPSVVFANLAAAVAAAGAAATLFVLLVRLCPRRTAVLAALLFAFATPTWMVSGHALWTHGPDQLWLLLALLGLSNRRYALCGLALGAAVLTRPHLAVVPMILAASLLGGGRPRTAALRLVAGSSLGLVGLLTYNRFLYGEWTLLGRYADPASGGGTSTAHADLAGVGPAQFAVNLAGTALSPGRGALLLTPFLLALLPGLPGAWATAPRWVRAGALGGLAYLGLQLWLDRFGGGDGFYTYRLSLETLTLCAPLLLLCFTGWTVRRPWRLRLFVALAAASAAIQALGVVVPESTWRTLAPWRQYQPALAVQAAGAIGLVVPVLAAAIVLAIFWKGRNQPPESRLAALPAHLYLHA